MSFLKSFKINGTEFVAQKATDLLMPKANDGDPDVTVAEAVATAKEIYIYETTEEGLTPDASGIIYEKTVHAGVRTEILEKIRAGFVVYLKLVDSSNQQGRLFLLYETGSNQLEGQNLNVVFSSNSIGYTHVYVGGDSNNTIIRYREGSIDKAGWGIAKTGIIDVPLNNQMWSTQVPVDITDLGFTSASDYMVFSEPTTGGTTSRWGDAIAYTNSFTATEFTVGVYYPAEMTGITKVKYIIFAKGYGSTAGSGNSNSVDKAYVDAADAELQKQKVTGYFERTGYPITLNTVGQPSYALARDLFTIEVENHKLYTYEFTPSDVYDLTTRYNETIGKTFIAINEDNETIYITMKGALPNNVQYAVGSTNPVVDLTNATVTLTKTTFIQQIDDMLIPKTSGEVFIFDVDYEQFTEDPENPGGKHYGMTIDSPTFDEIMDNLVSGKIVFVRMTFNGGNSYDFYQLSRESQQGIRGKAFDLEFPQGHIWFYDIYIRKRGLGTNTTTYFGMFYDKVVDSESVILKSPNGTKYKLKVADDGTLSTEAVV